MPQNDTPNGLDAWNRIADNYTRSVGSANDRIYAQFKTVLWDALGDLKGKQVLDLGCGHGWLSGKLAAAGAAVTGIDGSVALLEQAKADYPDIPFIQHDLTRGLPATKQRFDRVLAHMVLMDLPVLDLVIHDVQRALRPTGSFIFTLPHPCFFNQKMRRDAQTGQPFRAVTGYHQEEAWHIESFGGHTHYHRSLSVYFEQLRANGFAVARLFEPEHIPAEDGELGAFWRSIPVFILLEAVPLPRVQS